LNCSELLGVESIEQSRCSQKHKTRKSNTTKTNIARVLQQ
jgi:hypothetical protein